MSTFFWKETQNVVAHDFCQLFYFDLIFEIVVTVIKKFNFYGAKSREPKILITCQAKGKCEYILFSFVGVKVEVTMSLKFIALLNVYHSVFPHIRL